MKKTGNSGYRYNTVVMPDGTRKMEHVAIWEAVNGPKPENCDIHHKDGNGLNNDLENLVLMTKAEHAALHRKLKAEGRDVVDATDPVIIADRARKREMAKKHYREHKAEHQAKDKAYRESHKEYLTTKRHAHYVANHDAVREQQRLYELEHKEERAARNAAYYAAHSEERKEYHRQYQQKNKEALAERHKLYRQEHAEELKARAAKMRAEQREYLAAKQRVYMAKKKGLPPEVLAQRIAEMNLEKQKLEQKQKEGMSGN